MSSSRLSWTLEARRLKYSEMTLILSGSLAARSSMGYVGAAHAEAASAGTKNNEACIVL